jgi:hypothetical protein
MTREDRRMVQSSTLSGIIPMRNSGGIPIKSRMVIRPLGAT